MIGGVLFRRVLWRFLFGLAAAFLMLLPLVHVFQLRMIDAEWRRDLAQESQWLARHFQSTKLNELCGAWRSMHSSTRVTFFGPDAQLLADSHPELPLPDLARLRSGRGSSDVIATQLELTSGGWLVMSRPGVPGFPHGMQWEVSLAALLIVGLVLLLLSPFVRSISTTLARLAELAGDVSAGQFGKTLELERDDELGRVVDAFNEMSTQLAEAERLNTRLVNDVSHELRSPLARIQVLADSIAAYPDATGESLRGIGQEVELLDRLVGDLLQSARMSADASELRVERFSISDWARERLGPLESRVRASRLSWTLRLPEQDCAVEGDAERLTQAVGNLVDNAVHALQGRADARIEVTLSVEGDSWWVRVEDNGPGIPAEHRAHVFRRFYRVDEHRDRAVGGVGLGLSFVLAIARAHGGEASLESREGEGTRVSMRLPLAG